MNRTRRKKMLKNRKTALRFERVNENNWRLDLKVSHDQEKYVANSTVLLARAYAYRNLRSRAFIIYSGETPVGMVLYYDCPELSAYDLSQLFIDERYQGRGLGLAASKKALDLMRKDGKYKKAVLCYVEGNLAAKSLYEKLGFAETSRDGDEIEMELEL